MTGRCKVCPSIRAKESKVKTYCNFGLNLVLPSVKPSGAIAKRGTMHLT